MTIFLHPDSNRSLSEAYQKAFSNAEEIFALSAYLTDWESFKVSPKCKTILLIVGKDFCITRKKALQNAFDWKVSIGAKKCQFFVADKINGFHPKILLWQELKNNEPRYYLIIGSSNLTLAAFETNYEANARIRINKEFYENITLWIANILKFSRPVNQDWIDGYKEQDIQKPQVRHKSKSNKLPELVLPEFPGLAKSLAKRREQVFEFDVIKNELVNTIRECASRRMAQRQFYDWLIENWNGKLWKFQGSGVFRRDWKNTNWQLLCSSLVNIIDCNTIERDEIVIANYNKLEDSNEVEARKSVLTEMLCHFFPNDYALWNNPVEIFLKDKGLWKFERKVTAGEKYIYLSKTLKAALIENKNYPASNLAELDNIIRAYCTFSKLIPKKQKN